MSLPKAVLYAMSSHNDSTIYKIAQWEFFNLFERGRKRRRASERARERERESIEMFFSGKLILAKVSGTMCVSNGSSKKCKLGAVVVVVEWSACSPYTLMIRVRYPPKSTVFILYIVRLKRLKRGRD